MPLETEILGPEKDDRRHMDCDESPGIDLKINQDTSVLVYEIRVPSKWGIGRLQSPCTFESVISIAGLCLSCG